MPLEEIRNLLDGAIDLPTALAQQKDRLKAEQERIQGAILFCEWIQERKLEELDVDNCLQKMDAYLCEKEILKALLYFLQKRYNKHNKQRKYDRQCRAGSDGEHIVNVSR